MGTGNLTELVQRWSDLQVAVARQEGEALPFPVRDTGSTLRGPADPAQIAALEERLGVRLPPSYRTFLEITDGAWAQPGWGLAGPAEPPTDPTDPDCPDDPSRFGLLGAGQVGWFRDREREYVDIWTGSFLEYGEYGQDDPAHPAFRRSVAEREYLDHDRDQDPVHAKAGHVFYALQVSGDVDGYTVLLNPLVVDQHGEWEAWDFGSKLPGATRYRSFADLLAADVSALEHRLAGGGAATGLSLDPDTLLARVADPQTPDEDRGRAVYSLAAAGRTQDMVDLLLDLAGRGGLATRQAAVAVLGEVDDPRVLPALVAAAGDPEPRVRAAVVARLAASLDPEARRAVVTLLTNPDEQDFVISQVRASGTDALCDAWQLTRHPRLLRQLASYGDPRAVGPLAEAIVDPAVPAAEREWLVRYSSRSGDPALVPALVQASELPDAALQPIGEALQELGATDDATRVLIRALDDDPFGQVAGELGRLDRADATAALVDAFRRAPSNQLAQALGGCDDAAARAALLARADDADLHLAVVDGLERMPGDAARDALASLVDRGDLLAARALARRRDRRALPLLLQALESEDPDVAFEAADGLRDLRDPAAAEALFATVCVADDPDVAACAAHALVMLRVPETAEALAALAESEDADLRRLAELWTAR